MKREKVRVEIITEHGLVSGNYPIQKNTVLMKKQGKNRGTIEWKPKFTKESFIFYHVGLFPFKRLKRKLMILQDGEKFIDFKDGKAILASWDKDALENASKAHVLRIAGATTQKIEIPMILYLLLGAILFMSGYGLFLLMRFLGYV